MMIFIFRQSKFNPDYTKILVPLFLGVFLFMFAASDLFAQNRKFTVILIRHAEKDVSDGGASSNPGLSTEGRLRAARFAKIIKKYKPRRIYSTDYKRTKETAIPLSEIRKLPIQSYDPRKQKELVEQILSFQKQRRIVVVGHSNTIPAL